MAVVGARFLIGEGGPLRQFEARCHLTSTGMQVFAGFLVAWLPLFVLGLASELATGSWIRLLHDSAIHVRLLVAMPVLFILDRVFPIACSHAVDELSQFGFIRDADRARFDRSLYATRRLAEWWIPEAVLACLALAVGVATLLTVLPVSGPALRPGLSAADWYYALVSLPLFEFLVLRSLWRWAVWVRLLVGLSRLDLDLEVTHPDCRGGIGLLRKPSLAYCSFLLFVISAVLSASWGERFQFITVRSFIPMLLGFAVVAAAVAFGPLMLFSPQLYRARHDGLSEIGAMAALNGRAFRQRWFGSRGGELIENAEIQSLAALASTYRQTVKAVRLWPFEKKDLVLVLVATLLPVVPWMLLQIPFDQWLSFASVFVKGVP